VRAARAECDAVRQKLRQEVMSAALGLKEAKAASIEAEAFWRRAEQQLTLATSRYQAGLSTFVELAEAQAGLTTARAQALSARYDLAVNRLSLRRTTGAPLRAGARRP